MTGGDDGVDVMLLLMMNSVETIGLLLAAAKFVDLVDEKVS
jgi:hypothetical protein